MDKKNNTIIIIIAIVLLVVLALISINNRNKKIQPEPLSQSEIQISQAIDEDSIVEINKSLDNIDLTNTSEEDLKSIDEELENL